VRPGAWPGRRLRTTASPEKAPQNKAFKLTRSIGLSRMEALRATWPRLRRPSQLNAMISRIDGAHCRE
jgi:hypothetical protein